MEKGIRYLGILLLFAFAAAGVVSIVKAMENRGTAQQTTYSPEALEKRLSTLEDIEAIKKLQTEYVDRLQKGNFEKIEDFFTDDAVFEAVGGKIQGKEKIKKVYSDTVSKIHKGQEGDILTQPLIDLDGNNATAKWVIYFFYFHPKTYQAEYFVQSWFDMDYRKVDGKWKISRFNLIHHIEPPGGPPNDSTFLNFLDNAQKTMQEANK